MAWATSGLYYGTTGVSGGDAALGAKARGSLTRPDERCAAVNFSEIEYRSHTDLNRKYSVYFKTSGVHLPVCETQGVWAGG